MAAWFRELTLRFLLLTLVWWILTEGDSAALGFGLPVILLALGAGHLLAVDRQKTWTLAGLLSFLPFFFYASLRGGLDVARRVYDPRLPISPAICEFSLHLPPGPARVFLANTISLLPGTCSVSLQAEGRLLVHALDDSRALEESLRRVERRVAALFGLTLASKGREEANA
ncbi:Na+/H+ antiporter subunit E [Desulfuromonas sp. KJ2020]|uniref:Na+/H+ antiporter subunit E n=1 Tax=Desulfuromonas sp. KJ2020 TaxID=2919173 RepID=UPI0020A6FCDF|nr:Na+/H+ antiporter subunit E [Desulfuromonas sp. KJ2020]